MYVGTKWAVKKPINVEFIGFFGVPGGIRTHDLSLRSDYGKVTMLIYGAFLSHLRPFLAS